MPPDQNKIPQISVERFEVSWHFPSLPPGGDNVAQFNVYLNVEFYFYYMVINIKNNSIVFHVVFVFFLQQTLAASFERGNNGVGLLSLYLNLFRVLN